MSSLVTQSVPLTTNADGEVDRDVRFGACKLVAFKVEQGDLDSFDLTLTDQPGDGPLVAIEGISAGGQWIPMVIGQNPDGSDVSTNGGHTTPIVWGRIHVNVVNGGDTKTGRLILLVER